MSPRTPADVPDLPGASELTDTERRQVAELAARDAGGVFVPRGGLHDLEDYLSRHRAGDATASLELAAYLRTFLRSTP
jgi:hypothetical protein